MNDMQVNKRQRPPSINRQEREAFLFITPTVILLAVFLISPMFTGLILSLFRTSLAGETSFVGLDNFIHLLTEARFLNNLRLSLLYVAGNIGISLPLAYLLAMVITSKVRFRSTFRRIVLLPWVVAPVVSALLFRSLVDPNLGPISILLQKLTGSEQAILSHPAGAMTIVIVHSVWRSLPFMTLFLAAGMSTIPKSIYEAARVDGATSWTQFFRLTLPLTRSHLLVVLLTLTAWTLQDAESVYAMTEGGPGYHTEVVAVRLFKESFINFDLNSGATMGVMLLLVGSLFLILYRKTIRPEA